MEKQRPQPITSQENLDALLTLNGNSLDCFILLNYGLRSSKEITLNDAGDYYVYNECDGSEEVIDHDSLMSSFIGEAIDNNALFKY